MIVEQCVQSVVDCQLRILATELVELSADCAHGREQRLAVEVSSVLDELFERFDQVQELLVHLRCVLRN